MREGGKDLLTESLSICVPARPRRVDVLSDFYVSAEQMAAETLQI